VAGWLIALGLGVAAAAYALLEVARSQPALLALDVPNQRSSHDRPVPRGGGLVIALCALAGAAGLEVARPGTFGSGLLPCAVGAVLIAAVSWVDDRRGVRAPLKFGVAAVGGLLAMQGLGHVESVYLPFGGRHDLGALGPTVTLVWVVGLVNAYNFMDGIDGIAGGQAVVAGGAWALWGWLSGDAAVGALGALLAGSSLGFLGHNWAPARVFMGDVGAAFLGYGFAVLPLIAQRQGGDARAVEAGAFFVAPFIFDASLTIVRRALRGEKIWRSHRAHIYQQLALRGFRHERVSGLYVLLAVATSACGFAYARAGDDRIALAAAVGALVALGGLFVGSEAVLRRT
jgi:UDP-N-acetylmuramyl pentapeptide phosphotransferase/UDP-N-acetylglucosamine-1-phosphate transferase